MPDLQSGNRNLRNTSHPDGFAIPIQAARPTNISPICLYFSPGIHEISSSTLFTNAPYNSLTQPPLIPAFLHRIAVFRNF